MPSGRRRKDRRAMAEARRHEQVAVANGPIHNKGLYGQSGNVSSTVVSRRTKFANKFSMFSSLIKRILSISLAWFRNNFFVWLFRIFTLVSVVYLVYDRVYETGALILSPASDPKNPFLFPFSITNMSHIFTLRDIKWECSFPFRTYDRRNGNNNIFDDVGNVAGTSKELPPGGTLNFACGPPMGQLPPPQILKVIIKVDYNTRILWFYTLHRSPSEQFTWAGGAERPQWIRGQLPQ
jgi:hypothetical protein